MIIDNKILDSITNKITKTLPNNMKKIKNEVQDNLKIFLQNSIENLSLVTKEEFDIQKQVLLRTRKKIEKLEKQLNELLKK